MTLQVLFLRQTASSFRKSTDYRKRLIKLLYFLNDGTEPLNRRKQDFERNISGKGEGREFQENV